MLYRKSSPNPPRLLLRIVATAGAGALLGSTACSSSAGPCGGGVCGTAILVPDSGLDAGTFDAQSADAAAEAEAGQEPSGVGLVSLDAGNSGEPEAATTVEGGLFPKPDAEAGSRPCGGGPCGVVVMPHDAGAAE